MQNKFFSNHPDIEIVDSSIKTIKSLRRLILIVVILFSFMHFIFLIKDIMFLFFNIIGI